MNSADKPAQDRSVRVGGNATGNVFVTGDNNQVSQNYQQAPLPPPESVDIRSELQALQSLLEQLHTEHRRKIDNALEEAIDELKREQPDRDEVGRAVDRALEYAQKTGEFAGIVEKLKPHVTGAASWLGKNWYKILAAVGLTA